MRKATFLLFFLLAATAYGQESVNLARGIDPGKVYNAGDIDSINLFNGNLVLDIPIGPTFPVGGHVSYGFHLIYNGNPWDYEFTNGGALAIPSRFNNVALGWQFTMGELVGPSDPLSASLEENGAWLYEGPDGGEHAFFGALHKEEEGSVYAAPASPGINDVAGYTRDGSYLRLVRLANSYGHGGCRNNYQVDFPDGTRHYFESVDLCYDDAGLAQRYRLWKIDDLFDNQNWVQITYGTSTDTVSDSTGRSHTIHHAVSNFSYYSQSWEQRDMITAIDLAGFSGGTSTYGFHAGAPITISSPCGDKTSLTAVVPFLEYVTLPNNETQYSMWDGSGGLYYAADNTGTPQCGSGQIKRVDLPSGGRIEWTQGGVLFPYIPDPDYATARNPISGNLRSSNQFATVTSGVAARNFYTDTSSSTPAATWSYSYHLENSVVLKQILSDGTEQDRNVPQEEVVRVIDPSNTTTAHYFSVYRKELEDSDPPLTACFTGGKSQEYGLPLTHRASSGGIWLSTETFAGACHDITASRDVCPLVQCISNTTGQALPVLSRTYVNYETDIPLTDMAEHWETTNDSRLQATRMQAATDSGGSAYSTIDVVSSDFDGLGHYRTQTTTSDIGGGPNAVTPQLSITTHYNAGGTGSYPGSLLSQYMISPSLPWITGVFDYIETKQDPSIITPFPDGADPAQVQHTSRQEYAFDTSYGFLLSRRTLKNQTTHDCGDLLEYFSDLDAQGHHTGNVLQESYYGGDVNQLTGAGCSSPGTIGYRIFHTYQYGALASSQYDGTDFLFEDYTIDANTGFVRRSRNVGGNETAYNYDAMYRLTTVTDPAGGATTNISYGESSLPRSVLLQRCASSDPNCGTPLSQSRYYYDGLGRLTQSKVLMPDGKWSLLKKEYDGLDRVVKAYQPEFRNDDSFDNSAPARWMTYQFDFMGRPSTTTMPDGSRIEQSYTGVQAVSQRTYDSSGAATNGDNTVQESFDGHGRLVAVTEKSAASGASVVTSYQYDGFGRLVDVESSTQMRRFRYDDRGFLVSELGPEMTAMKTYSNFDAHGHAHHSEVPGSSQVDFEFDAAERPTTVKVTGGSMLKEFFYGGVADGNGHGRLLSAIRHNYLTDTSNGYPGVVRDYTVKDQYAYDALGRVANKTTTLSNPGGTTGDQVLPQTYTYDALGDVTSLSYPTVGTATTFTASSSYKNGFLTGGSFLGNTTSSDIAYHPTGMLNKVPHSDGTTDVITPDSGMARPSSIEYDGFTSCTVTPPDAYTNFTVCPGGNGVVAVPELDATTYQWSITGGQITGGANTYLVTFVAGSSGNVVLTLTETTSCGSGTFQLSPIAITPNPTATLSGTATIVPPNSTPLTVALTGAGPWQLTWSDGYSQYAPSSPATYPVSPTTTTNYSVTVRDANYCSSTSNTVTVTVASALSAPTSVTATAVFTPSLYVSVSWPAVAGATSYVIFRDNVQVGTSTTTSFNDPGVAGSTAYLYKVHAKNGSAESADSPVDLATTVAFNDSALLILAADVTDLRAAVNAVHRRALGTNYTFTDPDTYLQGHFLKGIYIQELRTALAEARSHLGLPAIGFTDGNVDPATNGGYHYPFKRVYIIELRGGVQ